MVPRYLMDVISFSARAYPHYMSSNTLRAPRGFTK